MKRVLQVAAVLVLVLLVALLVRSVRTTSDARAFVSDVESGQRPEAPGFDLPDLSGDGRVKLSDLRGKTVVVNFWASWCDPCKDEAPLLQELATQGAAKDVAFVGVDAQDLRDDARSFAKRYGLTYDLVHDSGNGTYERWGLSGFPETFVIDPQGRAVAHFFAMDDGDALRAAIQKAQEQS